MKILLLLIVLLTACANPRRVNIPPLGTERIRAWSEEDLKELTEMVAAEEPRVREWMQSRREPATVWMTDRENFWGLIALTDKDRIYLCLDARPDLKLTMIHELAHWHSFEQMEFPSIISEGIAVMCEVTLGDIPLTVSKVDVEDWRWALSLDMANDTSLTEMKRRELYLVGYWLVKRIGMGRLRYMHALGQTSAEDIARAADLPWPELSAP